MMPIAFNNISMDNITAIGNITNPTEFLININHTVYLGWFAFIMLLLSWYVLFMLAQKRENQPMPNLVITGSVITVLSLLLRFVYIINDGVMRGMLSDNQLWILPIFTIIFAMIAIFMKD